MSADRLVPLAGYTSQSTTASQGMTETTTTDRGGSVVLFVGREPGLASVHTLPRLALDYVPLDGVTIGTSLLLAFGIAGPHTEERTQNGGTTSTRHDAPETMILGFAPRVGYLVSIRDRLALWPRVGVAFYSVTSTTQATSEASGVATTTNTDALFSLDLDPQVVWTPLENLFVQIGPLFNLPLSGSHTSKFEQLGNSATRTDDLSVLHVGLSLGAGGFFSL